MLPSTNSYKLKFKAEWNNTDCKDGIYHNLYVSSINNQNITKTCVKPFQTMFFSFAPWKRHKTFDFLLFSKGYRKETLNWNGLLYLKIGIRIFLVSHSSSVKPSSLLSSTLESLSSSFSLSQTLHWRISVCTNSYLKHSYFRLQIRLHQHDINSRT